MATSVSGSTNEWFKIGNRELTSGRTGALEGEVLLQFLIEAAVLSALVGVWWALPLPRWRRTAAPC